METTLSAPLGELSGLARRGDVLYAVGDDASALLAIPIVDGLPAVAQAKTIPLPIGPGAHGSQLEGITFDDAGLCWVLQEDPAVVTVIDLEAGTVKRRFRLELPPDHPLAAEWNAKPNQRGEGIVLLPNGHVLIAKQKKPAALIEFAPPGESPQGVRLGLRELPKGAPEVLVATAFWTLAQADVNDVTLGERASLWVLSDADHVLCHISKLVPPNAVADPGEAVCDALYPIPSGLDDKTWEGLAFLDEDGRPTGRGTHRAVLVVDMKSTQKDNLAVVRVSPP